MKILAFMTAQCRLRMSWLALLVIAFVALGPGHGFTSAQVGEVSQVKESSGREQDKPQQSASNSEQSPAHKYFTDTVLLNQNGEKMRFYADLLHDKVVIINSFFATCQGSCLPLNRNLEKLQQALGDHVGKDVYIISISVDPVIDTPPKLKEYAKKLNARQGWYFLTGEKQNVDLVLTKLGHFVSDKQYHLNIFIIGNERTGLWKKAFGLASSDELVKVVESVLNDPTPGKN